MHATYKSSRLLEALVFSQVEVRRRNLDLSAACSINFQMASTVLDLLETKGMRLHFYCIDENLSADSDASYNSTTPGSGSVKQQIMSISSRAI